MRIERFIYKLIYTININIKEINKMKTKTHTQLINTLRRKGFTETSAMKFINDVVYYWIHKNKGT